MVAERGEDPAVLARLAAVTAPPSWVPEAPPSPAGTTPVGPGEPDASGDHEEPGVDDRLAVRTALASALATYTATHGHPLDHGDAIEPRRVRLAVGARVAAVAVVVLVLLVAAVVWRSWQRTPSTTLPLGEAAAPGVVVDGGSGPGADGEEGTGPTPEESVVVHVVGQVVAPGVVVLPAGSRVADAVDAAGGPTPDADLGAINLARVLVDGEQVVVPAPGEVTAGAGAAASGGTDASGLVDLNTADVAALDELPGIGPVLAERIVAWREEHGRFTAVEELTEVSGIGPAVYARLKDLVRVG